MINKNCHHEKGNKCSVDGAGFCRWCGQEINHREIVIPENPNKHYSIVSMESKLSNKYV